MAVSKQRRRSVIKRDGMECTYCGIEIPKGSITIDHVVPRKLGGSHKVSNLCVTCEDCNKNKGHLLLTQFLRAFEIPMNPKIARFL